ncbi:MAG: hypothetical protein V4557_03405 [Bacteroidota bacterium]
MRTKKGRRAALIVIILCVAVVIFHYIVFDVIVPKTAAFTTPQKWKMIPLRQTKEIVHGYFGEPVPGIKTDGSEVWAGGAKGKMYYLRIYYVSDTIASRYSIHYQYKAWFGSRDYLIDSLSIR